MDKTLVIGANGQIGRLLVERLAKQGRQVRAMVRKENQKPDLEALGAEVVIGDLEGEFEHALEGCSALVFTAGSGAKTGPDKTLLVDAWGAAKTINSASENNLKRYIMVSARRADDPDSGPEKIRPYLAAKHMADHYLMTSGLDYTILRPGRLINEPATGQVTTVRPDQAEAQIIPRADVADAIVFCLDNDHTIGKTYELYQGGHPLEEALADV